MLIFPIPCFLKNRRLPFTGEVLHKSVDAALIYLFTNTPAPSSAPVAACYCPYINIPNAKTDNFLFNLLAFWTASRTNTNGYFLAKQSSTSDACVAISTCNLFIPLFTLI